MKKPFSLGLIEESDIIGGGRGHGEGGGGAVSGAVLTVRDTEVTLVTPVRPGQSD